MRAVLSLDSPLGSLAPCHPGHRAPTREIPGFADAADVAARDPRCLVEIHSQRHLEIIRLELDPLPNERVWVPIAHRLCVKGQCPKALGHRERVEGAVMVDADACDLGLVGGNLVELCPALAVCLNS